MLDAIFGGGDDSFDLARRTIGRNAELYDQIKLPEYLDFSPELYDYENVNYELLNEDPLIRSAQMSALSKLSGLAEDGLSEVDQAGFEKARRLGSQTANAGTQAAIQNANSRGVGGSGLEFAMREIANQEGAERSQMAGLDQAANAAKMRAQYQMAYGDALNNQRSQDLKTESANKGIINQFNEMNSRNRNNTNNMNVDARNDAFMYNEGLKDKKYQNQVGVADRKAGFNNQITDIGFKENAQRNARRGALMGGAGALIGSQFGPTGAMAGYTIGSGFGG